MTSIAIIAVALLCVVAMLRRPAPLPRPEPLMPAFGVCANCSGVAPILSCGGRCSACGSSSIVVPYSFGAKLILRAQAAAEAAARRETQELERKRFLRAGTPERKRA